MTVLGWWPGGLVLGCSLLQGRRLGSPSCDGIGSVLTPPRSRCDGDGARPSGRGNGKGSAEASWGKLLRAAELAVGVKFLETFTVLLGNLIFEKKLKILSFWERETTEKARRGRKQPSGEKRGLV